MTIGASLFLIAVGAILTFAVNLSGGGVVDVNLIGVILMVAGAVGLLIGMFLLANRRSDGGVAERRVAADGPDDVYNRRV